MKRILSICCTAIISLSSFGFASCFMLPDKGNSTKNIILFIGDGMGENHLTNTLTYFDLQYPNFFQGRHGSLETHSADNLVTDSAAGATAFATGVKVNNGEIAQHVGENLQTIWEIALSLGKKVGVVTTDVLTGATPAAFSSHAANRNNLITILQGQTVSGVHLLMGEESSIYNGSEELFAENGYKFAKSTEEMFNFANEEKLIATLPEIRSSYSEGNETDFQLIDMVKFAMDFLENENGYFLMVESAYIDKFSHLNQLIPALCEVRSLFDCADYLYNEIGNDTALIVTADHESGRLQLAKNKEEMANTLYKSSGHSGANVPLFLKNCTFEYTTTPQNTYIFELCKDLFDLE